MKEIKAFIHKNRVADVLHALKMNNFCSKPCNLSITDVYGTLKPIDSKEKIFSIDLGEGIINEVKLELICKDELLETALSLISENAQTGQELAGYIYVSEISDVVAIKKIESGDKNNDE